MQPGFSLRMPIKLTGRSSIMAQFVTSLTLDCPPERVFDFISVSANRVKLSPPSLGLFVIKAPEVLTLGSQTEFKVHGFGAVQHVVHEIVEFDRPVQFTEKQTKG